MLSTLLVSLSEGYKILAVKLIWFFSHSTETESYFINVSDYDIVYAQT